MARKRSLDPDSWTDEKIAGLSIGAHLLWIGLISLADDEGRIQWSARQFKVRLFAGKDDVTINDIKGWMGELSRSCGDDERPIMKIYQVEKTVYALHPKWHIHQYTNRKTPSKIPAPNDVLVKSPRETHGGLTEDTRRTHGVVVEQDETPHAGLSELDVPSVSVSVSVSDSVSVLDKRGVEAAASPRRMVKPDLPDIPPDAFGSLEADVARFVALAAAENSTGKISLGRIQSLRRALLAARDEFPHAFSAALREANLRGKPSVNYLRAIAKNHEAPQPSAPKPDDDSLPDYLVAAAELHKRDFGVGGAA